MKIVVMSDTHLTKVTDTFEGLCERYCSNADLVIHLGDLTAGTVLHYMEQYPLEAVAGNMDDDYIRSRLSVKKIIRVKDHRIGIIHGWGQAHDLRSRLSREFSGVDAVLFGHTHRPLILEENGVFWFNPGSVSLGRDRFPESLGILHIDRSIQPEIIPL